MKSPLALLAAALASCILGSVSEAATVTIPAERDNTLYESATGTLSNGSGEYIFAGKTDQGRIRRAVIRFDIAGNVPAGSTINSVTLRLNLSRTRQNTQRNTSLHRVLSDWGEGGSNADQNEGQGAPADTGDCTWLHRFRYPDLLWSNPGGDYAATASATSAVGGNASYSWSSAGMVADVQGWLDSPGTSYGWLILGDESASQTAKRFDSSENGTVSRRPSLTIDYTPAGGATGACSYADTCEVLTASACAALGGTYQGDGTTCPPAGTTVTVAATLDNTLYQDAAGSVSNGAGTKLIVSKNAAGQICRGTLRFQLAPAIPSNATITAATLTLYNAETGTGAADVTVSHATADWGEGTSAASGTETTGAPATTGDATWIHRFYPGTTWTTAGGDFVAASSALTNVAGEGFYSWSSGSLLADVQNWVSQPATNHGWILRGRESGPSGGAVKRFESRESADPARRPTLRITYTAPPPGPSGACCLPDATCDTLTAADCAAAGGTYQGDGTTCPPVPACPLVLEAFVDSLPRPGVATPVSGTAGGVAHYQIAITELSQRLHRDLPPTRVWGYGGGYPGPTIEAGVDKEVTVTWVNDLRDSTGALRTSHYLPVDLCLHGPHMEGPTPRVVAHLHGGHVEDHSDGYPDRTILPGQSQTFHYPNHQLPATLWYHDHALGITRLNVMMGLAGYYILRDSVEAALNLPSGIYEVPLAIQDRTFRGNGSMVYPAAWEEHFFGDKALVNGKVWPYLRVHQGKYRFRVLDGSNARAYRLRLSNGAPMQVIGLEGGLLPAPVAVDSVTLTPGERVDMIVDFAPYPAGTEILLLNSAPAPYPNGMPGEHPAIPEIMKFIVEGVPGHTAPVPASLRLLEQLQEADAILSRDLVLQKTPGSGECGETQWRINGLGFDDVREFPVLGTTEVWRFVNRSGTAHPMHMHLVMFQIIDRQPFTLVGDSIVPSGPPVPPSPHESGWKDTAPALPNEILRVIARFDDYAGRYPYHCHLLEHEDNEMMRQFQVVHAPVTAVEGAAPQFRLALHPARPNPFNPQTQIDYVLRRAARARLDVFDVAGRLVATLMDGIQPAGPGHVRWNGKGKHGETLASGIYAYRLSVEGEPRLTRKMVLLK
jgi:spore coat protein A